MLTTKTITPQQGKFYYAQENYYSLSESQQYSQWSGRGAEQLRLKGQVKPEVFQNLLSGQLPNGECFRTKKPTRQGYKERGGVDCTFSAPKSVSLSALVKGECRVERAHRLAVSRTLKILESRYATTRVRTADGRQVVNTGNLVIAQFHHDTSRELDPHLHTHCVLINGTQLDNGQWYSLRDDEIYAHKKLLGMIYQNELAGAIKKLGYQIEPTGNGQFEIKDVPHQALEYFSQRRQQIKEKIGNNSTWLEREKTWNQTRITKGEPIHRLELQNFWRKELDGLQVEIPPPRKRTRKLSNLSQLQKAIGFGIEHCSKEVAAFKTEAIEKFILNDDVGNFAFNDITQAIDSNEQLMYRDKLVTTQSELLRYRNQQQVARENFSHLNYESINTEIDIRRSTKPSQRKTRKFRVESPNLKARARRLSVGINGFTDQEEIERLKVRFERINRHLKNSQFSTGRTEALRNSIEHLNRTIAGFTRQQTLEAVHNINQYAQLLQQPSFKERAKDLATAINDISEQIEVEQQLTPAVTQLNLQLQEYAPNNSTEAIQRLHFCLNREQIMQNLNQKISTADQARLKLPTQNRRDAKRINQKLSPKIQLRLNSASSIEQKRQLLRQEYERLRARVRSNPNFQTAGTEQVDLAVAMLLLKESVNHNQAENSLARVGQVLSQSECLFEWKQSMPDNEYKAKAKEYVIQTFEQANQLRENILALRKNQEIEPER